MTYFRSKKLIIGLIYLATLLIASFSLLWIPEPPPLKLLYEDGKLVSRSPFTPFQMPPFGSNKIGENLFYQVLEGAKYTIGFVLLISIARLLVGMLTGIVYAFWLAPYKKWLNGFFQVFYYIPTALLAYILIRPFEGSGLTVSQYIACQVLILILVAIPPITVLLGEEIHLLLQEDFITSSRLMGASRTWILSKQLYPFLKERLLVFFMDQVVQVLTLFTHLGILALFLGGSRWVALSLEGGSEAFSATNEWSGLIGKEYYTLYIYPWLVLIPLLFFALTILSCNLILKGIKEQSHKRTFITQSDSPAPRPIDKGRMFEFSSERKGSSM